MISLGIPLAYLGILFLFCYVASLGFPGATVSMLSMGALATDATDLVVIMLVAAVAAILGDLTAYELARRFSEPVSKYLLRFKFYKESEGKARQSFHESAFSLVFFTRFFLMALGTAVSYIAGFERMERKKYALAVISGETLYGIIYPAIGFAFKETWNDVYALLSNFIVIILLLFLFVIIVRLTKRYAKRTSA